eukprot:TRINITY_DN6557_c0_g1_i4.p4 TRINITY_DN6557_c0_g1~~TRINITY_DN6557_c0_g1_i4.p4  ORF type:complete len:111 (+),score=7.52 TRINITY_DN6557_c0_g1_i4:234-566(+)
MIIFLVLEMIPTFKFLGEQLVEFNFLFQQVGSLIIRVLAIIANRFFQREPCIQHNLKTQLSEKQAYNLQVLQQTEGFAEFENRRKSKFDKIIGSGVLLGSSGVDQGADSL